MSAGKKVCHLTTVHPRYDTRIFHKECKSLRAAGFEVTQIVNDGLGEETVDGIRIVDIGGQSGRLARVLKGMPAMLRAALQVDAEVYHFHDPELIPVGLLLCRRGKHVIYDSHEDLANDIYNKPWIPGLVRKPLSGIVQWVERFASRRFSCTVCTTPTIQERFSGYGARTLLLRNYPQFEPRDDLDEAEREKEISMCYAGSIAGNRGLVEMVHAAERSKTRLLLCGRVFTPELFESLRQSSAWQWVDYRGVLGMDGVQRIYEEASIGLAIYHPDINYVNSLPIKLFECMSYRLPVICSNFPGWDEIVRDNDCGIQVDPMSVDQIVEAIESLKADRARSRAMGANGQRAVTEHYNWRTESTKVTELYRELIRP